MQGFRIPIGSMGLMEFDVNDSADNILPLAGPTRAAQLDEKLAWGRQSRVGMCRLRLPQSR